MPIFMVNQLNSAYLDFACSVCAEAEMLDAAVAMLGPTGRALCWDAFLDEPAPGVLEACKGNGGAEAVASHAVRAVGLRVQAATSTGAAVDAAAVPTPNAAHSPPPAVAEAARGAKAVRAGTGAGMVNVAGLALATSTLPAPLAGIHPSAEAAASGAGKGSQSSLPQGLGRSIGMAAGCMGYSVNSLATFQLSLQHQGAVSVPPPLYPHGVGGISGDFGSGLVGAAAESALQQGRHQPLPGRKPGAAVLALSAIRLRSLGQSKAMDSRGSSWDQEQQPGQRVEQQQQKKGQEGGWDVQGREVDAQQGGHAPPLQLQQYQGMGEHQSGERQPQHRQHQQQQQQQPEGGMRVQPAESSMSKSIDFWEDWDGRRAPMPEHVAAADVVVAAARLKSGEAWPLPSCQKTMPASVDDNLDVFCSKCSGLLFCSVAASLAAGNIEIWKQQQEQQNKQQQQ